jgi:hypothetical protein
MSLLDLLPTKVLEEIVSHIPTGNRKELSALSCSTKRLRAVVEPHLYRNVRFDYEGKCDDIRKQLPVHLLLCTLVHRFGLFSLIEHLELHSDAYHYPHTPSDLESFVFWEPGNESALFNTGMELAITLIHSFNPPSKDQWIQGLHDCSFKFCTALLLSQLVNLKKLFLHAVFCKPDGFVPLAFHHSYTRNSNALFPNIEHVEKDTFNWGPGYCQLTTLNEFLPFFYLPSLKMLRIVMPDVVSVVPSLWSGRGSPVISNLTSLVLTYFKGSVKCLGQILYATPNLKSPKFHY